MDLSQIKLLLLDVDGTMTDGSVYIMDDGTSFKRFHARDGIGVKNAMKHGVAVGIISHSLIAGAVEARAKMMGMQYCYVGQEPKLDVLNGWLAELDITSEQVAFIGDDVNDAEIMQYVGVSACPTDAHPDILKVADIILKKHGGYGCVREFVDEYLLKSLKEAKSADGELSIKKGTQL